MVRFKRVFWLAGFALLIFYLTYHMMTGALGVRNWLAWHHQEATLGQQLAQLKTCRAALQDRIHRLSDDSLDLDYLEERAHALLYLADPADKVMLAAPLREADTGAARFMACEGMAAS